MWMNSWTDNIYSRSFTVLDAIRGIMRNNKLSQEQTKKNQCKWSEERASSVLLFKSLPRNWRYNFSHFQFVAEESWNKLNCSLILLNHQIFLVVLHKLNILHQWFSHLFGSRLHFDDRLNKLLKSFEQQVSQHSNTYRNNQTSCLSGYSEEHTSEWFLKLNNS